MKSPVMFYNARRAATSGDERSAFAFAGNSLGFAAALCSTAPPSAQFVELPQLHGFIVVPQPLFGIKPKDFEDALSRLNGDHNSAQELISKLISQLCVAPEDNDIQAGRVAVLAAQAADQARNNFEHTNDIAYSTDIISGSEQYCGLWVSGKLVSDQALLSRFGKIIAGAIDKSFGDLEISRAAYSSIEAYIIDEVRERTTTDAVALDVFYLRGPENIPTYVQYSVDGFLADQLKFEYSGIGPAPLNRDDGLVISRPMSLAHYKPSNASIEQCEAALRSYPFQNIPAAMQGAPLTQLVRDTANNWEHHSFWSAGSLGYDAPPPGFCRVQPVALLELATLLAQAKLGLEELDKRNVHCFIATEPKP